MSASAARRALLSCPTNIQVLRLCGGPHKRKNFLFVHSEEAGKALALLYSLVVSCTRVGVNPVEYLADGLDRIDKTAVGNFAELLPDRWKPPPKAADPNETSLFDA